MAINKLKLGSLGQSSVNSDNIVDGTIVNADISPSAAIANAKVPGIATLCTTATSLSNQIGAAEQNIALLGFKMAVNDGLTIFNLIDGVVDEFHDESGTDEAEGSNDHYCATNDVYSNNLTCLSAGYTTTSTTEEDTGEAGTNPSITNGTFGVYTVPSGITSVGISVWGAGGGQGAGIESDSFPGQTGGGGGGYAAGTLAVTGGQTLHISAGEGGGTNSNPQTNAFKGGGEGGESPSGQGGGGGGLAGVFSVASACLSSAPHAYVVAGSGGGMGGANPPDGNGPNSAPGGAGGGLTGDAGGQTTEQTNDGGYTSGPVGANSGGGGDQEQGGNRASEPAADGSAGSLFTGGDASNHSTSTRGGAGGGGSGYYGGGGGGFCRPNPICRQGGGGGGSSYYGHPSITSGSTEEGSGCENGGTCKTGYVADTGEGTAKDNPSPTAGEDGFVLITGQAFGQPGGGSSTIISNAFTSTSVATTSRIVVFQEDVQSPTLNTDIIASISRDGGSNFTTATLSDSGYVTGSSGQRILTGQATISGQPSGQSMRWKLALANNTVKIHGVALQWA